MTTTKDNKNTERDPIITMASSSMAASGLEHTNLMQILLDQRLMAQLGPADKRSLQLACAVSKSLRFSVIDKVTVHFSGCVPSTADLEEAQMRSRLLHKLQGPEATIFVNCAAVKSSPTQLLPFHPSANGTATRHMLYRGQARKSPCDDNMDTAQVYIDAGSNTHITQLIVQLDVGSIALGEAVTLLSGG